MTLWLTLGLAVVFGVLAALVVFAVLYRAVSNVVDWVVGTFGRGEGR